MKSKENVNNNELQRRVEDRIRTILSYQAELALKNPGQPDSMAYSALYEKLVKESDTEAGRYITVGLFNYVVREMKRVGLIGLAKGGKVIFLESSSAKAVQS